MRKTFTLLLLTAFAAFAQFKISQYPNTNNLASNQLFIVTAGNTNMTIAFGQLRLITGTNLYEVSSISSYFVTNINNYSFTTNQIVYETNIVNNQFVTNQTVYQTNINNYLITTNLFVTETNITSWTITTNLTVINNITANRAYITNIITDDVMKTNRTVTVATNATSTTLDFLSAKDWVEVPTLMVTNLVLSPTNLMAGREVWVFFTAANGNYDITVTNTAETAIRWNMNSSTNGSTSFTVTNGQRAELALLCRSNNVIHAVYGYYR